MIIDRDFLIWKSIQARSRLNNVLVRGTRFVQSSEIALAGAYYGLNVGDNALYQSVKVNFPAAQKVDLYKLNQFSKHQKIIIGGGAVGVKDNIRSLMKQYEPDQVFLVGIDFAGDLLNWARDLLDFLAAVPFISTRSQSQCQKFQQALPKIHYAPDNAFGLRVAKEKQRGNNDSKVLGINLMNLFLYWNGRRFVAGSPLKDWYSTNNSEIVPYLEKIGPAYLNSMKEIVQWYINEGWEVIHFPFTPVDQYLAAITFKGMKVSLRPFLPSPTKLIGEIATVDLMISTRFHAIIFSLLGSVPVIPVFYAQKCEDLVRDAGKNPDFGILRTDFVNNPELVFQKLTEKASPATLTASELNELKGQVQNNFKSLEDALH